MGKSTARTPNYRQDASRRVVALATFRQQMADFARAELLVQLRERKRLSQEAAANEIGVSTKSLRAWEHGGGIRWHNAKKVAAYYGVEPESLVTQEEDRREVTPDLMPSLDNGQQLDRIERKVDACLELLRRLVMADDLLPEGELGQILRGEQPTPQAEPASQRQAAAGSR